MKRVLVIMAMAIFVIPIFGDKVIIEPFSPGESKAIEIYEAILPLLEACEPLFEETDVEITFVDVEKTAKQSDIDMDDIEKAVEDDPFMAFYTLERLREYSFDHFATSENVKESSEVHKEAGIQAERHAQILEILIEKWAPEILRKEE